MDEEGNVTYHGDEPVMVNLTYKWESKVMSQTEEVELEVTETEDAGCQIFTMKMPQSDTTGVILKGEDN